MCRNWKSCLKNLNKETMISYFIKFALIHLILLGAYKLFFARETQLTTLRMYILLATGLALILPLIHIPVTAQAPTLPVDRLTVSYLPEMLINSEQQAPALSWWLVGYLAVSTLIALRILLALIRIWRWYHHSTPATVAGIKVRLVDNLQTSFTFFNIIFIDTELARESTDIIRHEAAHVKYRHSYDLLALNLLTVPFWWVPSIWLSIAELRKLHEYQADAYALAHSGYHSYLDTILSHVFGNNRLQLIHSFSDISVSKRLKFMKAMKKRINIWKLAGSALIAAATMYVFACQPGLSEEELNQASEILEVPVSEDNTMPNTGYLHDKSEKDAEVVELRIDEPEGTFMVVDNPATAVGGIEKFYEYVKENLHYPASTKQKGIEGRVFLQFDVQTDGSLTNIKVLKGIDPEADAEAVRVLSNSPRWNPASHKGIPVKQRMVLPITFRLQ